MVSLRKMRQQACASKHASEHPCTRANRPRYAAVLQQLSGAEVRAHAPKVITGLPRQQTYRTRVLTVAGLTRRPFSLNFYESQGTQAGEGRLGFRGVWLPFFSFNHVGKLEKSNGYNRNDFEEFQDRLYGAPGKKFQSPLCKYLSYLLDPGDRSTYFANFAKNHCFLHCNPFSTRRSARYEHFLRLPRRPYHSARSESESRYWGTETSSLFRSESANLPRIVERNSYRRVAGARLSVDDAPPVEEHFAAFPGLHAWFGATGADPETYKELQEKGLAD